MGQEKSHSSSNLIIVTKFNKKYLLIVAVDLQGVWLFKIIKDVKKKTIFELSKKLMDISSKLKKKTKPLS